jgi:uncharacterized protein YndB with AHSA1/START domain
MGDTVRVTTTINAPAELVWDLISDVTRMGEWSPETRSCRWIGEPAAPEVGARFTGSNAYRGRRWRTTCTVTAAERGREFAFDVVGGGFLDVATWRYAITPTSDGCEIEETFVDRRNPLLQFGGVLVLGVTNRAEHNRRNMVATLERLKSAAEGASGHHQGRSAGV